MRSKRQTAKAPPLPVRLLSVTTTGSSSGEGPYGGTAAAIPGTALAENYDTGGQGVGYSVTSVNGTDNSYRSDGVDLETIRVFSNP